jgi:hypothetical protein
VIVLRRTLATALYGLAGFTFLLLVLAAAREIAAGDLDPPGAPGSTMRALDEVDASWAYVLDASGGCTSRRFQCVLLGPSAVLDKETGLVWEGKPNSSPQTSWTAAYLYCLGRELGGRRGWRLPTIEELQTLADFNSTSDVTLPEGHPFAIEPGVDWWTATFDQALPLNNYADAIDGKDAASTPRTDATVSAWCVREGPGFDRVR